MKYDELLGYSVPDEAGTEPRYTKKEREKIEYVEQRMHEMFEGRKKVGLGKINIEKLWDDADRAYEPYRPDTPKRKYLVQDESLGFRSVMTTLGREDWQSRSRQPNPYVQIQTALAIMVDANPEAVFFPSSQKFDSATSLMKGLYKNTWHVAKSKSQLKLMVMNGAKYGILIGRTFPKKVVRTVRELVEFNPDDPSKNKYEEKEVVDYDDVFRENLNPRHVWIDDNALPGDMSSASDVIYYKRYTYDKLMSEFEGAENLKYVSPYGSVHENSDSDNQDSEKEHQSGKGGIDVYFYENKEKDWYCVKANGVWIYICEPLPTKHKRLSVWWAPWTLRDDSTPYGIGIYEAMRDDNETLDRIRNMTIDQLVMSIYKFWVYSGTNQLDSDGKIIVQPGSAKQVKDVNGFKEVGFSGPGSEAFAGIEMFQKDVENDTGVIKTLQGEVNEKTAYQSQVARESSLRRLRLPLENIAEALEQDGYITLSLIEQIYSIPEVIKLSSRDAIEAYLEEIGADPALYNNYTDESTGQDVFEAKVPREIRLGLEQDQYGQMVETEDEKFFRVHPSSLHWEGMIRIEPQSILSESKELKKQMDLELFNLIMPILLSSLEAKNAVIPSGENDPVTGQPKMVQNVQGSRDYIDTVIKPVKNILRQYDKEPSEWLPNWWLQPLPEETAETSESAEAGDQFEQSPAVPGEPPVETAPQPQPLSDLESVAGRGVNPAASEVGAAASQFSGTTSP